MLFPLIAVFTGLVLVVAWISTRPQIFNYPMGITESNAQSAYREGERMMVWTQVALVVLYAGAAASTIGWDGGILVAAGLVGMLGAVIAGLVAFFPCRRTACTVAGRRKAGASADAPALACLLLDDVETPVVHGDFPIGTIGRIAVVGDEERGHALLPHDIEKQIHDGGRPHRIER